MKMLTIFYSFIETINPKEISFIDYLIDDNTIYGEDFLCIKGIEYFPNLKKSLLKTKFYYFNRNKIIKFIVEDI
jgi:hypothetical protein